ncbi:MAG: hypothetical protein ACI4E1_12990 [Lachnospira sp.]
MGQYDIKLIVFIVLVLLIGIYVTVTDSIRKRTEIVKRINKAWGRPAKFKGKAEDYDNVSHYFLNNKNNLCIDDITWNDLGMDDIFKIINNTNSSVGQEYLYKMLRQPEYDKDKLKEADNLIEAFSSNEKERIEIQKIFVKLGRVKGISISDYIDVIVEQKKQSNFIHYLSIIIFVSALIFTIFVNPVMGIWVSLAAVAFSILSYYKYKAGVEKYFICVNQIVRMTKAVDKICALNYDFLKDYNDALNKLRKDFVPITRKAWLIESGTVDGSFVQVLLDYLRMFTHADLIKYNNILGKLDAQKENVYELIERLGRIESCIAIASFRQMLPYWSKPEFHVNSDLSFEAVNLFHPLISEPVSNSIIVNKNVLLTGSNASGKSTFLKTVAINAILAQTIFTSVSKKYSAPMYRIYSSMALRDDLSNSSSYYMVEIKSLKRILDAAGYNDIPELCFVDEVLRGTNTVERIAASSEILKSLCTKNVLCFAATHDIELTTILKGYFDNYHFQEEVTDDDVKFNFKLYKGPATTRNAIKLLGVIGYDKNIIRAAENSAAYFCDNGSWKC